MSEQYTDSIMPGAKIKVIEFTLIYLFLVIVYLRIYLFYF